jgi:hypothetical protein
MKKIGYGVAALAMCCMLMGMGSIGGDSGVVKIIEPEKNFKVRLVDQEDVSVVLEQFSCQGQVYFPGKRGKAEISIAFERIAQVDFFLKDRELYANVALKDGSGVEMTVDQDLPCLGKAEFANVKIRMEDVKQVVFLQQVID